jgi:hypothetical protein
MRRAARTDANHGEIIKTFRNMGFSVADTSRLGDGFPDCVIARNGLTAMVEIKDGTKPPSERELTPKEIIFRDKWRGDYYVVESEQDALVIGRTWLTKWRNS